MSALRIVRSARLAQAVRAPAVSDESETHYPMTARDGPSQQRDGPTATCTVLRGPVY